MERRNLRKRPDLPGITDVEQWNDGRSRKGVGRVIQLAVFLSGLIFTAIACFALKASVNTMMADDNRRLTIDAQERISGDLTNIEESIRTISAIVFLSENGTEADWKKRIVYAVPGLKKFDRLLVIRKDAVGQWTQREIVEAMDTSSDLPLLAHGGEENLKNLLTGPDVLNDDSTAILINQRHSADVEYNQGIGIKEQPFVIAHLMRRDNPEAGIVIGISRVSNMIGPEWLAARPMVERIQISDMATKQTVFEMNRNASLSAPVAGASHEGFNLKVGNSHWQLVAYVGAGSKSYFLEQIPVMMLIAGLLLTMAATMYVYNRQKSSLRLTAVNRALAEKNLELNTEVTERARLNNILRKAERENKAIIDSISDVIFEVTPEGDIVFLNKAWEKITGFNIEQSTGRKLFDMLHPQDQDEQRRNFEQMVRGQKSAYRALTRIRTANGTFRAVELAVSMLRLDENRNMRAVGALTDVEERRRAEKALGEVEKKFRTIVENAAGGIYQVTPEGQFLSANPAMARILEYESVEQMLREVKNAHQEIYDDRQEHSRYLGELEKFGTVKNFENRVRCRSGRLIWVNENARAVKDDEGNILYFEGSMEDVSRRKEIEIKLREAKIQSDLANRAKSEFLANMSHELRTPLNAIIGFSEIIKDEVLGPVQNKQYWEYARDIHSSGKGLLKIISEILEISRIETGERQMVEGVVDVGDVAKSCLEFLAPKAEAGRVIIVNNLDARTPRVIGEALAVKQIMLNLLSNAIKFTPAGGQITLSHETDGDGQLRISITDTGIGLDEQEIVKALSPFGQVDSALSRSGSGTGLGLTLVDSLIRMHGGKLELFSQKGIGTTATIVFPSKRVEQREAESQTPQHTEYT